MKTFILIACVFVSVTSYAQQFANILSVDLPDSAVAADVEWVDLDNDGVLDVFVFSKVLSGQHFFVTYKSDTVQGLINAAAQMTGFHSAVYTLTDFDKDNDIDLILSGNSANKLRTSFFENRGDFEFIETNSIEVGGSLVRFADLNANGTGELIVSGNSNAGPFFHIYQMGSSWKLMHDSLKINAVSVEVFDFDGDGDNDIFISGEEQNLNVCKFLTNQGGLYFKTSSPTKGAKGNTSISDFNSDGRLDIFLTGTSTSGESVLLRYFNQGDSFIAKDSVMSLLQSGVFPADFNSDGKCDIQFVGKSTSGDTLNAIALRDSTILHLNKKGLRGQAFGDYDRDGDLDVIQSVAAGTSLQLQIWQNEHTIKNKGPKAPFRNFAFTIFNKLFLWWDKAEDDHTAKDAITYDVTLQGINTELLVGEFDLIGKKRLTVSGGNAGTRNYILLKPAKVSSFSYFIQAIDNSFETFLGSLQPNVIPDGQGSGTPCPSEEIIDILACKNETLTFTAHMNAQWFSLSKGFLAESLTYKMRFVAPDTIFSFTPDAGCPSLKIYLVKEVKNVIRKSIETRFACEGQIISLSVEPDWTTIHWKSQLRGNLDTTSSINYNVAQNDTVTVFGSNGFGCGIEHKTALRISKPLVFLDGDMFQILKGESVQLSAHGGETYAWSPEESLNNSSIANPIATPLSSTDYTVSVADSIGCSATANVKVIVEGTAFIPNLFTPNDDGKNDEVKVYGIATVSNFTFVIHNREGNILYETKDSSQVSGSGWDGTSKGVKQPAGVYYWKVKGEHPSGRKLLLNGRTTGSIVLIR